MKKYFCKKNKHQSLWVVGNLAKGIEGRLETHPIVRCIFELNYRGHTQATAAVAQSVERPELRFFLSERVFHKV